MTVTAEQLAEVLASELMGQHKGLERDNFRMPKELWLDDGHCNEAIECIELARALLAKFRIEHKTE